MLWIMARIDSLYLEDPWSGSRRMVEYLDRERIPISLDRVRNLMRRRGLRAIYQKPRTTVPVDPAERFPCLVNLKQVSRTDQCGPPISPTSPCRMALEGGRKEEIFHSDRGCQFTSSDFMAKLQAEKILISRAGKKRCYDNILVGRLWRTVKHEEVYLHACSDGWEAEISLTHCLRRYCHVRPRLVERHISGLRYVAQPASGALRQG
jgi:putative transposase